MKNAKFNKSEIMSKMHRLVKAYGMSKSEALIKAWELAKLETLENELFNLNMKDISGGANNIFSRVVRMAISQGANGETHKPLEELNQFLSKKSHEGKSYLNER